MTNKNSTNSLPSCPALLFIKLWREIALISPARRATSIPPTKSVQENIKRALESPIAKDVCIKLHSILTEKIPPEEYIGRCLFVMRAIDKIFYRIHPRARFQSAAPARPSIPTWLRVLQNLRRKSGMYAESDGQYLIPRGPLVRQPREETASNSDSLADRFAALGVVRRILTMQDGQPINILHRVVPSETAGGVPIGSNAGAELVAFIPVAEHATDIVTTERKPNNQYFVDFRLNSSINAADRIFHALQQTSEPLDIVLAPELVVSEDQADALVDGLLSQTTGKLRLIVAGSGQTKEKECDQPWNEARILNGNGTELWRQRKILPAGLLRERAIEYGLSDPKTQLIFEDTAAGKEITIADIYGLGRCVVLICQDLNAPSITEDLIRTYQPDWILTPILDPGIEPGKWAHQRAFHLSSESQARFLIASSTALANKINPTIPRACGLAVGPKLSANSDAGRIYIEAHVATGCSPGYALVRWRSTGWKKSILS